jgi:hypothetical protein
LRLKRQHPNALRAYLSVALPVNSSHPLTVILLNKDITIGLIYVQLSGNSSLAAAIPVFGLYLLTI